MMLTLVIMAALGVTGDPQLGELQRQLHMARQERVQLEGRIDALQQRFDSVFLDRCDHLIRTVEGRAEQLRSNRMEFREWLGEQLPDLFASERRRLRKIATYSPDLKPRVNRVLDEMLRLLTQLKNEERHHFPEKAS